MTSGKWKAGKNIFPGVTSKTPAEVTIDADELASLRAALEQVKAERSMAEKERDFLRTEVLRGDAEKERLYHILRGYKAIGTDGCKTCETGRVSLFVWNERCIQCDPKSYEVPGTEPPAPAQEEEN